MSKTNEIEGSILSIDDTHSMTTLGAYLMLIMVAGDNKESMISLISLIYFLLIFHYYSGTKAVDNSFSSNRE